jgi:hypothetical protein
MHVAALAMRFCPPYELLHLTGNTLDAVRGIAQKSAGPLGALVRLEGGKPAVAPAHALGDLVR